MEKFKNVEKIGDGTYGTVIRSLNRDTSKFKEISAIILKISNCTVYKYL